VKLRAGPVVHGGETIARLDDGRVVFVRGAAPGDLIEAELVEEDRRFLRARALRVLEPGQVRVAAPCVHLEACGGCPIQQVSYQAQLDAKTALLADALERIGGFSRETFELRPIVRSPQQLGYRRRARMHRAGRGAWGFAKAGTASMAAIDRCLLFEPLVQEIADALGDLPGATDVAILAGEKRGALDIVGEVSRKQLDRLAAHAKIQGITHGGAIAAGDPVVADPPSKNGARLRSRPDTFAQANRSMVPALQAEVARLLEGAGRVLELYCGSGTLTLPLLDGRQVTAAESAGPSLSLLRRSADEAGLAVKLVAGDAAQIAASLPGPFDAALLDPPRTGAAAAVQALAASKMLRIVYVSCDAPTLARDGKLLAQRGFRLVEATPLDLFPQTAHFEMVALFARTA
jgi:23S rRNA (uracil1939-C5)-methyltransferase